MFTNYLLTGYKPFENVLFPRTKAFEVCPIYTYYILSKKKKKN